MGFHPLLLNLSLLSSPLFIVYFIDIDPYAVIPKKEAAQYESSLFYVNYLN
jgi:hypothetical protein